MYCDRNLINRRNVGTDVSQRFDACKQFFLLEVRARIVAAFLAVLGMKSIDDIPTDECLPPSVTNGAENVQKEFLHGLAAKVVDKYVLCEHHVANMLEKQQYADWLQISNKKTEDGRFLCRQENCGKSFRNDGKLRVQHEKIHGLHASQQGKGRKPEDAMLSYQCSVLNYGLLVLNFFDGVSEGDGARIVRCWKYALQHLRNDKVRSQKYALEAMYLLCQINGLLANECAEDLIWNRFHKSKTSDGGNIPQDLCVEHYNNLMKNVIRYLGPNARNRRAVDRFANALTVTKNLLDNFDQQCAVHRRSGIHTQACITNDLRKIVNDLMKNCALQEKPGRQYTITNVPTNLLDDFDVRDFYSWIEKHKEKLKLNRAGR